MTEKQGIRAAELSSDKLDGAVDEGVERQSIDGGATGTDNASAGAASVASDANDGQSAQAGGQDGKESDLEHATRRVTGLHRPTNRAARLNVIEQILLENIVSSQAQLSVMLSERGIDVTQATLSRDLDEMNATKSRLKNGRIAYTIGAEPWDGQESATEHMDKQLSRGLAGLIVSVASARNLVVVHTPAGAAQYMASVIDRQPIDGILGTVAGDDTVLLICASDDTAKDRSRWLLDVASGRAKRIAEYEKSKQD